jgi:hypothetical protein
MAWSEAVTSDTVTGGLGTGDSGTVDAGSMEAAERRRERQLLLCRPIVGAPR